MKLGQLDLTLEAGQSQNDMATPHLNHVNNVRESVKGSSDSQARRSERNKKLNQTNQKNLDYFSTSSLQLLFELDLRTWKRAAWEMKNVWHTVWNSVRFSTSSLFFVTNLKIYLLKFFSSSFPSDHVFGGLARAVARKHGKVLLHFKWRRILGTRNLALFPSVPWTHTDTLWQRHCTILMKRQPRPAKGRKLTNDGYLFRLHNQGTSECAFLSACQCSRI